MESLVESVPTAELAVGLRTYLEITRVTVPSEAEAGSTVNAVIEITNVSGIDIRYVAAMAWDDIAFWQGVNQTLFSGSSGFWMLTFIMPDYPVNFVIYARYWGTDDQWHTDDTRSITVEVVTPVGWQLLDSMTLRVDAAVVPPVGWLLLDTTTVAVTPTPAPPVGWQLLDTTTVSITAGPIPEEYELIEHVITPWAYFYEGDAEEASISFSLIKGTTWVAYKVANRFAKELADRGFTLLEGKFYKDAATIFEDKYLVKVSYTMPAEVGTIGVYYISPILWNIIFYSILGVLVAFLVSRAVNYVKSMFYSPPPFEESVKLKWEKPLIIGNILSQRPQYSSEELEAMSEGELRDLWDEIYKEEVPPRGIPWWGWAILGGVGIAGTSLALRFLPKRKRE